MSSHRFKLCLFSVAPLSAQLCALFALCALCALPVHAQSQPGSHLQVYGRLNLGLVHYGGYGPGHVSGTRMNSLSSRFGIKGSEDLGSGLQAVYMVETGFSADTGDGMIGSREASIGLAGNFGKLRLGYMLSPLDDLHSIAGPGWVTNVTNDNLNGFWANGYSNLFTGGSAGSTACKQVAGPDGNTNSFAFDNRIGNSVRYDSPQWNGWQFATQYALGEACSARAWSNKVQYLKDGWNLALAWQLHHGVRAEGLNDNILMFAGAYQITADDYAGLWWQRLKYANPLSSDLRQSAWGAIYKHQFGAHLMEVAWYHAGRGEGAQTPVFSGIFVGPDSAANLLILGWRYKFSKRTELWGQVAQLRNGPRSGYDLGGAGKAGAPGTMGERPRALALGIKHDF